MRERACRLFGSRGVAIVRVVTSRCSSPALRSAQEKDKGHDGCEGDQGGPPADHERGNGGKNGERLRCSDDPEQLLAKAPLDRRSRKQVEPNQRRGSNDNGDADDAARQKGDQSLRAANQQGDSKPPLPQPQRRRCVKTRNLVRPTLKHSNRAYRRRRVPRESPNTGRPMTGARSLRPRGHRVGAASALRRLRNARLLRRDRGHEPEWAPCSSRLRPGRMEAVQQFLLDRSDFVTDGAQEKFFLTFNPGGYLRRTADA